MGRGRWTQHVFMLGQVLLIYDQKSRWLSEIARIFQKSLGSAKPEYTFLKREKEKKKKRKRLQLSAVSVIAKFRQWCIVNIAWQFFPSKT